MIDFNCDMGEGISHEPEIMPFIHSANISCGLHAGDEKSIRLSMALALENGVKIGAHPSFDDRLNFGRMEMQLPESALRSLIMRQLESFYAIAESMSANVHHIKPHGALYNMAARDEFFARIVAQAAYDFDSRLKLFCLSGSASVRAGEAIGLQVMSEAFADRTYTAGGQLTPRSNPHALIHTTDTLTKQVRQIIEQQSVTATDGSVVAVAADTLCMHGDGAQAPLFARHISGIIKAYSA